MTLGTRKIQVCWSAVYSLTVIFLFCFPRILQTDWSLRYGNSFLWNFTLCFPFPVSSSKNAYSDTAANLTFGHSPPSLFTSELICNLWHANAQRSNAGNKYSGRAECFFHLPAYQVTLKTPFPSPSLRRLSVVQPVFFGFTALKRAFVPAAWFTGYIVSWEAFRGVRFRTSYVLSCKTTPKC